MVLFASSDFSVPTLRALAASSGLLEGPLTVVTPADKARGRGKQVSASPFKAEALRLGCQVVDLPDKTNFKMTGWDVRHTERVDTNQRRLFVPSVQCMPMQ